MATPTTLDLRDCPADARRERLFDMLHDADIGDELTITAEDDLDPALVRYQLTHQRTLDWTYADPDAEPRELQVTIGNPLDTEARPTIDVRDLTPQRRHEALLDLFAELGPGDAFVLVNDHDPKPLYHELRSIHGDIVEWEYENRGDNGWRVHVCKTDDSEAPNPNIVTRYDVRDIPKQERHPTIHHRYGMIPEGGTMELIAAHEPRSLLEAFREQYGESFTWNVVESASDCCRIRITKAGTVDESGHDPSPDPAGDATQKRATDDAFEITAELDVRDLPPAQRHEQIFDAYADLGSGEAFILVNHHDPKPLYHQFKAETDDEFRWEYRQEEPGEFRVFIGKRPGRAMDASHRSNGHQA